MTSIFSSGETPAAPPLPTIQQAPPPAMQPGLKPKAKSQNQTFLGYDAIPSLAMGGAGGKTLLGM